MKIENFVKQWLIKNYSIPNKMIDKYVQLTIMKAIMFYFESDAISNYGIGEELKDIDGHIKFMKDTIKKEKEQWKK